MAINFHCCVHCSWRTTFEKRQKKFKTEILQHCIPVLFFPMLFFCSYLHIRYKMLSKDMPIQQEVKVVQSLKWVKCESTNKNNLQWCWRSLELIIKVLSIHLSKYKYSCWHLHCAAQHEMSCYTDVVNYFLSKLVCLKHVFVEIQC